MTDPAAVEVRDLTKTSTPGRPNAVDALVDIDLTIGRASSYR